MADALRPSAGSPAHPRAPAPRSAPAAALGRALPCARLRLDARVRPGVVALPDAHVSRRARPCIQPPCNRGLHRPLALHRSAVQAHTVQHRALRRTRVHAAAALLNLLLLLISVAIWLALRIIHGLAPLAASNQQLNNC